MILLISVLAGSITGLGIAKWQGRSWGPPTFGSLGLVFLGFLPQYIAFYLPSTRQLLPDELASVCLVMSQIGLLVFAGLNLKLPGMRILIVGLICNLAVILANGGFMPLSVETVTPLLEPEVRDSLVIGERIGKASKDIFLPESQILLPWLADRFIAPKPFAPPTVFSLGDIFVAAGAFWLLLCGQANGAVSNPGETL